MRKKEESSLFLCVLVSGGEQACCWAMIKRFGYTSDMHCTYWDMIFLSLCMKVIDVNLYYGYVST